MKRVLTILSLMAMALAGCAARKMRGYPTPIPGCAGAFAWVPAGCYPQKFDDRVEIRCDDGRTTKFKTCVEGS